MYPLDLLMIEHKRRMSLEIWNRQKLRDVPAPMDDNAAEVLPGALPTEKTSPDPSTRLLCKTSCTCSNHVREINQSKQ